MSSASFHFVHPDSFPYFPLEALRLLEATVKRSGTLLTPQVLMARAATGLGEIYVVTEDAEVVGAFYLLMQNTDCFGKVLNIPLFGGKRIMKWKDDMRTFVRRKMMDNGIEQLIIISRDGWSKIFPELKKDSVVYTWRVTH